MSNMTLANAGPTPRPGAEGEQAAPDPLAIRLEREIRAGHIALPVLPKVALEVQNLIDADADTAALVHAIEREPTVAAALLRYANAAVYAGLRDVSDLQQAIMRLGRSSVRHTVVSLSARSAFTGDATVHHDLYQKIWTHSLTTAIAARRLAAFVSVSPETAFLAGLLHDIGKIVVLRGIETLRKRDPVGFKVAEHTVSEFMDALHCSVGETLCKAWNIPNELRDAVARHHVVALTGPEDVLAAIVQVADLMAIKVGASLHPDPKVTLLDRQAAELLRLDDVKIASLIVELEDERDHVMAIL